MFNQGSIFLNRTVDPNVKAPTMQHTDSESSSEYFGLAIESVMIMEKEYRDLVLEHLTAIHYANLDQDEELAFEGFKDMLGSARTVFDNVISKFKEAINNINRFITAYLASFDIFIREHGEYLKNKDVSFEYEMFDYTFSPNVPNVSRIDAIVKGFNDDLRDLDNRSASDIADERLKYDSDDYMDELRGEVLGMDRPVMLSEYAQATKSVYRDGQTDKHRTTITKATLGDIVNGYPELKRMSKDVAKERDRVVIILDRMKTFFEASFSTKYRDSQRVSSTRTLNVNGTSVTADERIDHNSEYKTTAKLDALYSYRLHQSKTMAGIMVMAVTAKVDAVRENINTYRTIARIAVTPGHSDASETVRRDPTQTV